MSVGFKQISDAGIGVNLSSAPVFSAEMFSVVVVIGEFGCNGGCGSVVSDVLDAKLEGEEGPARGLRFERESRTGLEGFDDMGSTYNVEHFQWRISRDTAMKDVENGQLCCSDSAQNGVGGAITDHNHVPTSYLISQRRYDNFFFIERWPVPHQHYHWVPSQMQPQCLSSLRVCPATPVAPVPLK